MGTVWATPENDYYAGERQLHIANTRERGNSRDFWMFAPPFAKDRLGSVCGVCKTEITGKHCPRCWGKEES